MKKKTFVVSMLVVFLLLAIVAIPVSSLNIKNITQNNEKPEEDMDIVILADIECDIKAKTTSSSSWQDSSVTAAVNTKVDFKIEMTAPNADIIVAVLLPYVNDEPLLDYVILSGSEIPIIAGDSTIIWGFTAGHAPSTITYQCKVKKTGTGTVELAVADIENEVDDEDSISVTGKSGCCFPAGTLITMADKSQKPIEQVRVGERVLSYDLRRECFTSWTVKMLGDPVHPIWDINDGQLQLTIDHPLYIKKADLTKGIGAIDAELSKNFITYKGEVLTIEIGDEIFTSEGEWIKVTKISHDPEPVQTYNILSYSGQRTYFANGILVYEEHPPNLLLNIYLDKILDHFQRLARPFQHPIFQKFT